MEFVFFPCVDLNKQSKLIRHILNENENDKPLWIDDSFAIFENYEECDFYAVLIDTEKNNVVGRVKAIVFKPGIPNDKMDVEDIESIIPDVKKLPKDYDYIYISDVDINPEYRGKKYCQKLLQFLMDEIYKVDVKYKYFVITNVSETEQGIPACRCYIKSGLENGYDVYESSWDYVPFSKRYRYNFKKLSIDDCVVKNDTISGTYYYIKKRQKDKKKSRRKKGKKGKKKKGGSTKKIAVYH